MAERAPYQPGVIFPAGRDISGRAKVVQFSFRQLNEECDRYAARAEQHAHPPWRPSPAARAPRGRIDRRRLRVGENRSRACVDRPRHGPAKRSSSASPRPNPRLRLDLPAAHVLRKLVPKPFATIEHLVVVGGPAIFAGLLADARLEHLRVEGCPPFPVAETTTESEAAVAFTSGILDPHVVVYHHGMFKAQIELLRTTIGIEPGEVDLALLYVFALFNPALGVTTVIPDMDPTKSAEVDPAKVVEAIQTYGVTNAFGSPTIWKRVVPYRQERGIRLPSIRRVLMAGAPVPPDLIEALQTDVLSDQAEVLTPFGATEAMPLTSINGHEIADETATMTEEGQRQCARARPFRGSR